MGTTLTVACVLGFFPVQGLKGNRANSLRYRMFSLVGILSIITTVTLVWTAILSIVRSAFMLIKATVGKSGKNIKILFIRNINLCRLYL